MEKKIGHKLPAEYLELLKNQNGGYIRYSLPEMVHNKIAGIGPHFPSLTQVDLEECQEYVSFQLEGLVPFDGDGHWFICVDYRRNATTPSVTYVDIETDSQSGIADTFGDYLAMLEIDVGDEYVLEKVSDIETVKACLSKCWQSVSTHPMPGLMAIPFTMLRWVPRTAGTRFGSARTWCRVGLFVRTIQDMLN